MVQGQRRDTSSENLKVCLAISSYRNDEQVAEILQSVCGWDDPLFTDILVVDSHGSGRIPKLIARRGWTNVQYYSYDRNLGSAGNLAERLRLAAQTGADYVYTINHDGAVNPQVVRTLLEYAGRIDRPGAVYPLRYRVNRGQYDLSGTRALPLGFRGTSQRPSVEQFDVRWSSSNGALYALEPIRNGVQPWADLWMGYEDFGYGRMLKRQGYRQIVVTGAIFEDRYEYTPRDVLGHKLFLTDKPAWYTYYQIRNLLLIAPRAGHPVGVYAAISLRFVMEALSITLFRPQKLFRYKLLMAGLFDGLRGRTGKGRWP
jgi:GT2 family glycosyltransferase